MKKQYCIYFGLLVAVIFLVAACDTQKNLTRDYGTSYKLQKFSQTLNPQAAKNLEPIYGFDGQAADRNVAKYEKSFEEKVAPPTYNFSISTGGR